MSKPAGAGRRGGPRRREKPDLESLGQLSGRITALEPQAHDPKRRSVYIDGAYVLGLHEETIILARLKVGLQVDGPRLAEALRRDEAKRAWDDALTMLAATGHTQREVERRLERRYPAEVAQQVVDRLVGGGWLNDAEYARSYIRSHSDCGERKLLADLVRKGVAREVALVAVQEALGAVDATAQAREAAAARLQRISGVDRETARRRLSGYLLRRGYGFDVISRALEPLLQDLPAPPRPEGRSRGLGFGKRRGNGLGRSRWGRAEEGDGDQDPLLD